jgi:hypothetical protein
LISHLKKVLTDFGENVFLILKVYKNGAQLYEFRAFCMNSKHFSKLT